jgi:hypothetical protein
MKAMHYRHLNPSGIEARPPHSTRRKILAHRDVLDWRRGTGQPLDEDRRFTVTFIVDVEGWLWIADRHSEHYACAAGGDVLSAGEMTFELQTDAMTAVEITNQSLGYCPEPESWPSVENALNRAGMSHPGGFTTTFIFRRCETRGAKNLVKDDWYCCALCNADLPWQWNFGQPSQTG